jgi:hypothetical protein
MWLQLIDKVEDAKRIPEGLVYLRAKSVSMITELTGNDQLEKIVRKQLYRYNRKKIQKYSPSLAFSYERILDQKDFGFIFSYKFKSNINKLIGKAE